MSMKVQRIHIRGFLEHIEIPVVGVVVSASKNQPAVAQVQIVPTPAARRIPPRTKIDIYFHDMYPPDEQDISRVYHGTGHDVDGIDTRQTMSIAIPQDAQQAAEQAAGAAVGGETAESLEIPDDLVRYRLLFTGEVLGLRVALSAGQVAVVLQCSGCSNYWDQIAADQRGGALFGPSSRSTHAGYAPSPFWDLLAGSTGQVFEKLTEPPSSMPNLRGFSAGLINLMEAMFGAYHRRTRSGTVITGANQFLTMANLRLRLMQQVGVAGGDDSPLRLLRNQGFGSIWRPALKGLPRYFSYRHLLEALMPYTFYEHVPILSPHYTPPTGTYASYANWGGHSTGFLRNSPEWRWIVDAADSMISTVRDILDVDLGELAARREEEGDLDLSEYEDLSKEIRASMDAIRLDCKKITDELMSQGSRTAIELNTGRTPEQDQRRTAILRVRGSEASFTDEELAQSGMARVTTIYTEARRRLEPVANNAKAISTLAATIKRQASCVLRVPSPVAPGLNEIYELATKIAEYAMPPPGRRDEDSGSEPAQLYSDVLRPDVWFCAPPRSNVLFPDQIVSMSYDRDFTREATRLMVRSSDKWLGSHILFDKWWIAPTIAGTFGNRPLIRSGSTMPRVRRDLLDHELYTGIIPIFQKMGDKDMILGARVSGFGSNASPASDDQKRYFQQVTNFLLFRARFAARVLQVQTVFNPYIIMGFPALVVSAPTNPAQTAINQDILNRAQEAMSQLGEAESSAVLELIRNRTGIHYLGCVHQITHSASATGENCGTSLVLSYAREHNEKIEFMGQDMIRLAQESSRRTGVRTIRRRPAAVDRLLREYHAVNEEFSRMSSSGFDGRIGEFVGEHGGGTQQVMAPGSNEPVALDGMTFEEAKLKLFELMNEANQITEDTQIQIPTRKTSLVFALDAPFARIGTPGEIGTGTPASEDFRVGQPGPNGGEIVEAEDVTDRYMNHTRPRNVSGEDPEMVQRYEDTLPELRDRAEWEARAENAGLSMEQQSVRLRNLSDNIAGMRDTVGNYRAGWRQEYVTLPFISTPRRGRNTPVTTVTTDKVGIPVDVRDIPQLVSIIGTNVRDSARVILKVYRIVEDLADLAGSVYDMPAEDVIRPPWYGVVWTNALIGGAVYLPLFGVGAVVDPTAVLQPSALDEIGNRENIVAQAGRIRESIYSGGSEGGLVHGILEGASIENAVDFLAHTYSLVRGAGSDVNSFIRDYTWRPIASMFDMYGSGDLEFDPTGKNIISGVEGFHSRAAGPYSNLFGLVPQNDVRMFLGVNENDTLAAARVDVRGRRYALIQAYRMELLHLRGSVVGT